MIQVAITLMVVHRIPMSIMLYLGPQIGAAKDQVGADVPVFERMTQVAITGFWEQITVWLIANPERTGVSLFQQLQDLYPGRFRDAQARTLQRGLQKLRARLLITFDDQGTRQPVDGPPSAPVLRALATVRAL